MLFLLEGCDSHSAHSLWAGSGVSPSVAEYRRRLVIGSEFRLFRRSLQEYRRRPGNLLSEISLRVSVDTSITIENPVRASFVARSPACVQRGRNAMEPPARYQSVNGLPRPIAWLRRSVSAS